MREKSFFFSLLYLESCIPWGHVVISERCAKLVYMEAILKRSIKDRVIRIQCFVRQRFARDALARLSEERRTLEKNMATRVQANARFALLFKSLCAVRFHSM